MNLPDYVRDESWANEEKVHAAVRDRRLSLRGRGIFPYLCHLANRRLVYGGIRTAASPQVELRHKIWTKDMGRSEESAHDLFSAYRRYGEWFELSPKQVSFPLQSIKGGTA
ncbi:MAG: hypothetical protein DCF25_16465 [Leptolyngbya foveolarum]|uniref:Uncharacterized protein n=1 Tax=Leptolyngbya foveolarum TaxID=47253 RepID=A0A2W4TWK7_9CYAN|nr:MAG: hypothetical protein DCF25_16465 [Leptolyngbya foveolarum]